MAGMIEKDELKKRLGSGWVNAKFALRVIDSLPVVDIVHCTECVHCGKSVFAGFWFCDAWDEDVSMEEHDPAKYYCAEGLRAWKQEP